MVNRYCKNRTAGLLYWIIILFYLLFIDCSKKSIRLAGEQTTNAIVFVAYPAQKTNNPCVSLKEVYIIKAEPGAEPIRITYNTNWEESPAWIENGKSITVKRCVGRLGSGKEKWYLIRIDLDIGKEDIILEADATIWPLSSSKNLYVYYGKLYLVDLNKKTLHELLTENGVKISKSKWDVVINDISAAQNDDMFALNIAERKRIKDKMLFKDECKHYELAIVNRDGTNFQILTNDTFPDGSPAISPDGKFIAFESQRDGYDEIFIMEISTRKIRRLTDPPMHGYSPTWSPDGKKIAFLSDRDGFSHIYIINVDGTGLYQLTKGEFNVWSGISWSPR